MKKICLLLLITLMCTSCSRSITCKESGTENKYKIVVSEDNKIKEIVLTYTVQEKDEEQAKRTEKKLREQFTGAENFRDIRVKRNVKTVTLTANVDYNLFFSSDKKSIEDVKKYFEGELNMKCYE